MVYFCKKCAKTHQENELCPHIKRQIGERPDLLGSAADFVNVAGQYQLITSQGLDTVAQGVNSVIGTNLSLEGTHQLARDIQVFNRLDVEAFSRKGYFRSPEVAKAHLENVSKTQLSDLRSKIAGQGGEVDWLRMKQGEIQSIWEKSSLYTGNAKGADGVTFNRFTGEEITRVTAKSAGTPGGMGTGPRGIIKALEKGTLAPDEGAVVTKGMKDIFLRKLDEKINEAKTIGDREKVELFTQAKENLKITEYKSVADVAEDVDRMIDKIKDGKANTVITRGGVLNKAAQGAVIGAAVGLTISSLTNYIHYRNGELSRDEAFTNIAQDTTKGTLIGGAIGAVTLFLPGGVVGFVAGMAIGCYLNAALTNVLDEIFGKGAYREILIASGCIMGVSMNLSEAMKAFADDRNAVQAALMRTNHAQTQAGANLRKIDKDWRQVNMSTQTEIHLTSVNISDRQDIEVLIQAASEMQNATESNFKHMQDKNWYKRLWEMMTFSKNNQKVLAKNVASLAQMQDVTIKALLMVSGENREIADYLTKNSELIRNITALQPRLVEAIDRIRYEHEPRPDIRDVSQNHQYIIVSTVLKFVDISCADDVPGLVQEYLSNLQRCCGRSLSPKAKGFDYNKIQQLNSLEEHRLLAIILCEAAVLLRNSNQSDTAFEEIKRYIHISDNAFTEIENEIKDTAKLSGDSFIASFYANLDLEEDLFMCNSEEIEFEEACTPEELSLKPAGMEPPLPPDDILIAIGKLSKLEFAPADSPQPIADMDYSVRLPFVKYLVNFWIHSRQPCREVVRFACDIGFTEEQLAELNRYIADPNESDFNILLQIDHHVPYGSRKSLRYALMIELYSQLYLAEGEFRKSVSAHEFIRATAERYKFSNKEIDNFRVVAQVKDTNIAGQNMSVKELKSVQKALTDFARARGVSLEAIVGPSFLLALESALTTARAAERAALKSGLGELALYALFGDRNTNARDSDYEFDLDYEFDPDDGIED